MLQKIFYIQVYDLISMGEKEDIERVKTLLTPFDNRVILSALEEIGIQEIRARPDVTETESFPTGNNNEMDFGFPQIVNNYNLGERRGGFFQAAGDENLKKLLHCKAYRKYTNNTGEEKDVVTNVNPRRGAVFPAGSVTVFVADRGWPPQGQSGKPKPEHDPTDVNPLGESIDKPVPDGKAIFVHFESPDPRRQGSIDAHITVDA